MRNARVVTPGRSGAGTAPGAAAPVVPLPLIKKEPLTMASCPCETSVAPADWTKTPPNCKVALGPTLMEPELRPPEERASVPWLTLRVAPDWLMKGTVTSLNDGEF